MGMNELFPIEVVLTYMDGHPVMLVKTAPTTDYDSATEANAWVNRVTTGSRCRAIAMTPINGQGAATPEDAEIKHEPRCPMDDCIFEAVSHALPHQDKEGELWDEVDLMGNRVVKSGDPETRKPRAGTKPPQVSHPA